MNSPFPCRTPGGFGAYPTTSTVKISIDLIICGCYNQETHLIHSIHICIKAFCVLTLVIGDMWRFWCKLHIFFCNNTQETSALLTRNTVRPSCVSVGVITDSGDLRIPWPRWSILNFSFPYDGAPVPYTQSWDEVVWSMDGNLLPCIQT